MPLSPALRGDRERQNAADDLDAAALLRELAGEEVALERQASTVLAMARAPRAMGRLKPEPSLRM
jgi:hypothetical protein